MSDKLMKHDYKKYNNFCVDSSNNESVFLNVCCIYEKSFFQIEKCASKCSCYMRGTI